MTGGGSHHVLYEASDFPVLQNRMYSSRSEARDCIKGDIRLVQDSATGLVHNSAFKPHLVHYDGNYQNEQACSAVFVEHLHTVARIIEREVGRCRVIEVGCGKGYFLRMLRARGFEVLGFDPAYEGNDPGILKQNFDAGAATSADAIVLRHVLEHIPAPYDFLAALRTANKGAGKIYIEVPCFDWICRHRAWYDVFYEHVNYFRLGDFHRMFGSITASGHLFGGQYLYVLADLGSLRVPRIESSDRISLPADFGSVATRTGGTVDAGKPAAVWGAASKGVIFSLIRERSGQPVNFVIDINPAKQGKYLPATGLLVQGPGEVLARLPTGSTIFVMNSNYLAEVRSISGAAYSYVAVDAQ